MTLFEWLTIGLAVAGLTLKGIAMLQNERSKRFVARRKHQHRKRKEKGEEKVMEEV